MTITLSQVCRQSSMCLRIACVSVWVSVWTMASVDVIAGTSSDSQSSTGRISLQPFVIDTDVNVQGFGGLINVPSAHAIGVGELYWTYSTLTDNGSYRSGESDGLYQAGHNLSFTASPFPGVEATIRNSGGTWDEGSDLQANIKYQATFIPKDWFALAAGYQDIGGITNHLDSYFVVASKDWRNLRLTIGTGKKLDKINRFTLGTVFPRRYEGGFYGIQYQPYEWLQLMAEHDGVNNAVAAKFKTPKHWFDGQIQLYGSVMTGDYDAGTGNDKVFLQVGVRANLFQGVDGALDTPNYETQLLDEELGWLMESHDYGVYEPGQAAAHSDYTQSTHYDDNVVLMNKLLVALEKHGFDNVWVGAHSERLYVRIENALYNRNQFDAIGVALGMTAQYVPEHIQSVDFTLSRYEVPTFRVAVSAQKLVAFYNGQIRDPGFEARVPRDRKDVLVDWVRGVNRPWLKPRVKFSPVLPNFIGTELGQADLNLSVRANVHMPLWRGGEVYADYDVNISESEDFDLGGAFWKYRQPTGLKNVFLRQTMQLPWNVYVSGGLGVAKQQWREEHNVATFQAGWQSLDGRHRLSYHYGYLQTRIPEGQDRYIYTAEYRHYLPLLDVSMYAEAGQFWRGDRGYKVGFTTSLGDSTLSVFMSETDVSIKGLGFSIPLGSRKNMAPSQHGYQVRMAERWHYSLGTSSYKGTNRIFVNMALRPGYLAQMQGRYFNFDRLSIAHLNNALPRLLIAYREFAQ
ncbi:YjbH domain-containing protein [Alteromonas sp. LMIT006]|uniref:YjbH domain-containing protein n=1 Tax=Alteromonadaceae TaxID=72275 RepID=UPI0020CA976D|nr:YjbH domain-containing protein [Alteromonas sp. LMIT006]UTP71932.1 YjbH domain-containing protein [Alteromonas sp. LMIT006]